MIRNSKIFVASPYLINIKKNMITSRFSQKLGYGRFQLFTKCSKGNEGKRFDKFLSVE